MFAAATFCASILNIEDKLKQASSLRPISMLQFIDFISK